MARKQIKVSKVMLFTWFMLAGAILLFAPRKLTNKFQLAFARIFQLPLTVTRTFAIDAARQRSNADLVSRDKYNQLENFLANITTQLENERSKVELLTGMRDRGALEGAKFVIAKVVTTSAEITKNQIVINRGTKDGLAIGQVALGDNSVIGTISELNAHFAWIKLFSDPDAKIHVRIEGQNTDYILSGNGNYAKIGLVSTKNKIERAKSFSPPQKLMSSTHQLSLEKLLNAKRTRSIPCFGI